MSKALERLRAFWKRRAEYFTNGRAEIAESNLRFLRVGSTATLFLLLVLLLVASLVIRSWAPSAFHLAFVPCAVLFCAGSWAAGGRLGPRPITALCVLFETMVYGFAIVLGVVTCERGRATLDELIEQADRALCRAKGRGKNLVCIDRHARGNKREGRTGATDGVDDDAMPRTADTDRGRDL